LGNLVSSKGIFSLLCVSQLARKGSIGGERGGVRMVIGGIKCWLIEIVYVVIIPFQYDGWLIGDGNEMLTSYQFNCLNIL
jgi:hypothetical protein